MSIVTQIIGREILDSRGNPTVEAEIIINDNQRVIAMVPSGASTGILEAAELRDNDKQRYGGKGVLKAVANINNIIAPKIIGQSLGGTVPESRKLQNSFDQLLIELDGTKNKENLGANALLAVSLALAKASALYHKLDIYEYLGTSDNYILPTPMMNIINGGAHADNNVDIQEFMIVPIGAPSFSEALRYGVEVFHQLKAILKSKRLVTAVGDEGGFAPDLKSNQQALELICESIEKSGFKLGRDLAISLDIASSELFEAKTQEYFLQSENKKLTPEQFCHYLKDLADTYPIISIEDGMAETDWEGWSQLTEILGKKLQLVGDDLFVTNTQLLQRGINEKTANAILIKPNQIGTLTETLAAIELAQHNNYGVIMSHRSGETEDSIIADLAVATSCGQIKTGSLCRSDRIAKYNQLLRIEHKLGKAAKYAGRLNLA